MEADFRIASDMFRGDVHQQQHYQESPAAVIKPGLEKTDSCYDSDDHDEDNADVARNGRNFINSHRDVSRTVSETLKEEYDHDGGTFQGQAPPHPELYKTHLAFALKLGYTEEQVQKALKKLGTPVTENAFLAELITLGAATPTPSQGITPSQADDDAGMTRTGRMAVSGSGSPHHNRRDVGKCANSQGGSDALSFLRHIVIDGSNVAMSHGNKTVFSCRGIQLCVDYFKLRGHNEITVFVPQWRKEASKPDAPIKDQEILLQLEREGILTFTPSRYVGKRRLVCYDDRYIIKLAMETEGVIVSNDAYRDLVQENGDYRKVVESHLLMYSFVNDRFMPPDDPLGRHGPTLNQFLRKNVRPADYQSRPCPYGKKCTYGNKCKFAHPERGNQPHKSVTEQIVERAKIQLQEIKERELKCDSPKQKLTATLSSPVRPSSAPHRPLSRTRSMVPGTVADGATYPRTLSPLATTSSSSSSSSSSRFLAGASPTSAVYQHAHSASSLSDGTGTGTGGLADQVMSNSFDRLFVGEDRFRSSPPQMRYFTAPDRSLPTQAAQFDARQSQVASPYAYPSHFSGHGLMGTKKHTENLHRPLSQTHSDPFTAALGAGPTGHSKLQRQLSLNPYGSQSFSDTSQFFTQTSAPSEDDFFTKSSYFAESSAKADSFFGHHQTQQQQQQQQRLVPQDNFLVGSPRQSSNLLFQDSHRIDLFDRLSCLFPEEKVRYAMSCYPHEYNVEKLCAAILKIFPAADGDI